MGDGVRAVAGRHGAVAVSLRLRVRVREGAARGLCGTCAHAHIFTDTRERQTVLCRYYDGSLSAFRVRAPLQECSKYERLGEMDQYAAEQIGWVLEVKNGRVVGFQPPKKKE